MAASEEKKKDLGDLTPSERHTVQVKFHRQINQLQKNEPKHEFLTEWSKVNGRKERNQIMAKWAANNYELNVESFRTKAEQFEDTKGLSGETFPREALVNMWRRSAPTPSSTTARPSGTSSRISCPSTPSSVARCTCTRKRW